MSEVCVGKLTAEEAASYRAIAEKVGQAALHLLRAARAVYATAGQEPAVYALLRERARELGDALWNHRGHDPNEDTDLEDYDEPAWMVPVLVSAAAGDPQEIIANLPAWDWLTGESLKAAKAVLRWAQAHGAEWVDDTHLGPEVDG